MSILPKGIVYYSINLMFLDVSIHNVNQTNTA